MDNCRTVVEPAPSFLTGEQGPYVLWMPNVAFPKANPVDKNLQLLVVNSRKHPDKNVVKMNPIAGIRVNASFLT